MTYLGCSIVSAMFQLVVWWKIFLKIPLLPSLSSPSPLYKTVKALKAWNKARKACAPHSVSPSPPIRRQLFRQRLSKKIVKAYATMPKGSLENTGRGIMNSELSLKFIGYFPDYLSALSRTLLGFFDNLCRNSCIHSLHTSLSRPRAFVDRPMQKYDSFAVQVSFNRKWMGKER